MSFYHEIERFRELDVEDFFSKLQKEEVLRILQQDKIGPLEFLALLSPQAKAYLEPMAQKAHQTSLRHFGKTILLYTPMYISNYCVNRCLYCGFNVDHSIKRKKMTMEEIEEEAKMISATGLKHILVLTGESRKESPVSYIVEAVKVLNKYFQSISIEIYPLSQDEYRELIDAGVDGVTLYQETYDESMYDEVHLSGPKKNYLFRLEAPERACSAGVRSMNIGALLGLEDWRKEAFLTAMHIQYLQTHYPEVEFSVSLPRIRRHAGSYQPLMEVNDSELVQMILAYRLFLPPVGITVSTREKAELRNHLIPLGVTKMSAGVSTEVGGHSKQHESDAQFEISDTRSVEEMKKAIEERGYKAIYKDWMRL